MRLPGRRLFDLGPAPTALHAASATEFHLDSRYATRIAFLLGPDGKATGLVVDPGRWAMTGSRIAD